jgi:predicted nuclease of predicted toxin-antitoxin system
MPKYVIDANLPRFLSFWRGDEYVFVADIDSAMSDQNIWDYARARQLTIVTKDADFTARILVEPDGPHVIHFRLGNLKIRAFHEFLAGNWATICERSTMHQLVEVFEHHIDCFE